MNEAAIRIDYIDPALKAAGWGNVAGSRIHPEYPITLGRIEGNGRRGKALTADYVRQPHKLSSAWPIRRSFFTMDKDGGLPIHFSGLGCCHAKKFNERC